MSRHGGQDNDVARGAGAAALKGAGLVLLAIIIGIVLLNVVDDGDPVRDTSATTKPKTTTTTKPKSTQTTKKPTTTTKAPTTPPRSPDQVHLIVLNAGAPSGSARDVSTALKSKGYTNQEPATDWPKANKKGRTVFCKAGLDREASALAVAVGEGAATAAFPNPAPPSSGNVDCVVAVGG
jgi:hypothetical protein